MPVEETEAASPGVRAKAADRIRAAIVSGELLPGQRLPERELCALTGAARTTVREVIRQLESEGLLTTISHRGPMVSVLTEEEARDIYEMRAILEGRAGRLFVERASDAQVEALCRTIEEIGSCHDTSNMVGVIESSGQYYAILTEGTGNKVLSQMIQGLLNRLAVFRFSSTRWPGRAEMSMRELRDIGKAVRARDADAAEAGCVRHIEAAAELALLVLAERARGAAIAIARK